FVPSNNESASYELDRTTDIGALDAAATAGGFTFAASDEWYASFGSFLLEEIDGVANEDWTQPDAHSWAIYRNGAAAMAGLGANDLADGDTLAFYYCPTDPATYAPLIDEATYIVEIDVTVSSVTTSGFTVTDATRGGTARASITITAQDAGWYAVVVSGVNSGGDSLAGIATVRLEADTAVQIPVLIAVSQQTQTGAYTLYAGIYTLDGYPDDMLCHCEGLECVVS
ncbi:MAG: hypothetical protein JXA08_04560, partial [Methanomicrobiaceae archaeon]|nr:hypothetical protein [Methanomicrobiaceae archaeon]